MTNKTPQRKSRFQSAPSSPSQARLTTPFSGLARRHVRIGHVQPARFAWAAHPQGEGSLSASFSSSRRNGTSRPAVGKTWRLVEAPSRPTHLQPSARAAASDEWICLRRLRAASSRRPRGLAQSQRWSAMPVFLATAHCIPTAGLGCSQLKMLHRFPVTWEDSVRCARLAFEKYFVKKVGVQIVGSPGPSTPVPMRVCMVARRRNCLRCILQRRRSPMDSASGHRLDANLGRCSSPSPVPSKDLAAAGNAPTHPRVCSPLRCCGGRPAPLGVCAGICEAPRPCPPCGLAERPRFEHGGSRMRDCGTGGLTAGVGRGNVALSSVKGAHSGGRAPPG